MDPKLLSSLNLGNNINSSDLENITKLLGSIGNGKKPPKMTANDRNNLISKLSSLQTQTLPPQKSMKSMTEDEKKIYRQELVNKLKNKTNEKKMTRTSKVNQKNNIGSSMNNMQNSISDMQNLINNLNPNTAQENSTNIELDNKNEENLDDYLN